jgi:hypothetical protein
MFVIHPDPYLLPSYRISPFRTADITVNSNLPHKNSIEKYFETRFFGRKYQYTLNGREALSMALRHYQLKKEDNVSILTTSGNFYISSCVTAEIEKYCRWSRSIDDSTRLILVNHEFGYPYASLGDLKSKGIPIIEDCAHSFFSRDLDNEMGNAGDFVIYSFPKMFPIQIGGLLLSNCDSDLAESGLLAKKAKSYVKNVLSYHIQSQNEIIERRLFNHSYLSSIFKQAGYSDRFKIEEGIVPGVFMFRTDNKKIKLPELKKHFYAHGVQCSVFYGEETFFIPVHQALNKNDMDYFFEVMESYHPNPPL